MYIQYICSHCISLNISAASATRDVSHAPNLNRKSTKVIQDYNDEAMFGMISPTYH